MASFYGGKQGVSYHIVERYDSVQAMVQAFNGGGSYTNVNYGQYVIIDTQSKSNPQNGLLYRRGFQYEVEYNEDVTNPGGGAIYIGQIVGPSGPNSEIQIVTWGSQSTGASVSTSYQGMAGIIPGIEIEEREVEGETQEIATFNDNIISKVVNIIDSDENIIAAELSFQIPYPVIRLSAQQVVLPANGSSTVVHSYFDSDGTITTSSWQASENNLIHSAGSSTHPFYLDYQIAVPKGQPGVKGIVSVGDNLYVQYSDGVEPSMGSPTTLENFSGEWYLFATSQGAYHVYGALSTYDLVHNYSTGFSGAAAGWVAQVGADQESKLYAYDYIGAGITPGSNATPASNPPSSAGYLENTYWKQVFDYGQTFTPYKFLATTTTTGDVTTTAEFAGLNIGGIIFRADTSHNEEFGS